MYRFIGGVLIVMSTTGAGFLYGRELQRYLENLLEIREILYLIKGEMEYSGMPLGEIFVRTARKVKEPYRTWLRAMHRRMSRREDVSFRKIWNDGIDTYLEELHLKKKHVIRLKELGMSLGQNDRKSEGKHFQLHLDRLEQEIEIMREELASKKRIGNCLGVMSGIFLVIILS